MNHAHLVGGPQCVGDLPCETDRFLDGQLRLPAQPISQRFALDHRHHIIEEAIGLTRIEQGEDVGVIQSSGNLDFTEESVGGQGGAQVLMENLDRDLTVVLQVFGQVNRGHATTAQLFLDGVPVRQGRPQTFDDISHPAPIVKTILRWGADRLERNSV